MTELLFTPIKINTLTLPNRLVRSATAERMADDAEGRPLPRMLEMYRALASGGVGLIISGHMYVHPAGKAHEEMAGVYDDRLLDGLAQLAAVVHAEGGRAAVQINHGGMMASAAPEPVAPSAVADFAGVTRPVRAMTRDEIDETIGAYGQAARRVKEAGFDAVQIHSAHGYLISQFLSPLVNRRDDEWGGDLAGRMRFLGAVARAVRQQVGPDYPVLIKLGMQDFREGGLTPEEGAEVAAALEGFGIDALEISGSIGVPRMSNIRKGIRRPEEEGYFRPLARLARPKTRLPILLVGGFRSREVMESTLQAGEADMISLCRPLIREPDLPNKMRLGQQDRSACLSASNCWARNAGEGIACKCPALPE